MGFVHRLGQPEIEDMGLTFLVHEDVGGLEISMDDAFLMCVAHGIADPDEEIGSSAEVRCPRGLRPGTLLIFVQRYAVHELHGEVGAAIARQTAIEERDDVRMFHGCDDFDFSFESHSLSIGREASLEKYFQSHLSLGGDLRRQKDGSLGATIDLPDDLVARRSRGLEHR